MMFLRMSVPTAIVGAVLFLLAGRLEVWGFWAYLGVMYLSGATTYTVLGKVSPGLLAERIEPPSDHDKATRRLVALPFLAHLVLAGLDARFGWSNVPLAVQLLGLVSFTLAFALVAWTLLSNPFASSAVRLHPERSQTVISSGPYKFVRHPMYLAVVLICLGGGVLLGSWFSALAMLPIIASFVRRTLLEDQFLRTQLDGYADYATRVPWRLIPHVY